MCPLLLLAAGAARAEEPLAIPADEPPPPPAPPAVVVTQPPEPPAEERLKSGLSIGLSAGLTTGFGPTFGIPFGPSFSMQVTGFPLYIPKNGSGGSIGLRLQQFVGHNPRTRLYFTEGVQATGFGPDWMWGFGAGAGVEIRKQWDTGFTKWVDLTVTAMGSDELWIVLPLPQAGIGWVF